jgi:hypothetical protein
MDWSEVWALLIPLTILLLNKQPKYLKPIIIYTWLALVINSIADVIANCEISLKFPSYFQANSFLYNIHSITRFICFALFFNMLKQPIYERPKRIIPVLSIPLIVIYFLFIEPINNPDHISGYFLAGESFLLLLYCMQYYLFRLKEDSVTTKRENHFWVVTGLSVYVVINFFVFLFYIPVLETDYDLALQLWYIHNVAYIIFCIFLAKAFYVTSRS